MRTSTIMYLTSQTGLNKAAKRMIGKLGKLNVFILNESIR